LWKETSVASSGVEFQHLPAGTGDVRSGLLWGFTRHTFVSFFSGRFGTPFTLIDWTRSLSLSATNYHTTDPHCSISHMNTRLIHIASEALNHAQELGKTTEVSQFNRCLV